MTKKPRPLAGGVVPVRAVLVDQRAQPPDTPPRGVVVVVAVMRPLVAMRKISPRGRASSRSQALRAMPWFEFPLAEVNPRGERDWQPRRPIAQCLVQHAAQREAGEHGGERDHSHTVSVTLTHFGLQPSAMPRIAMRRPQPFPVVQRSSAQPAFRSPNRWSI